MTGAAFSAGRRPAQGPSIEEELEKAIAQIIGSPCQLEAASRTDRGVHAQGQVVCFQTGKNIDPPRFRYSRQCRAARLISVVKSVEIADALLPPDSLRPRQRILITFICNAPVQSPINRLYSWHIPRPLDIGKMDRAAHCFLGAHDFSAFTNERTDDPVRTIERLAIVPIER